MLLPHFTRAFILRAIAAWGFVRLCIAGVSMIAAGLAKRPPPDDLFHVSGGTAILVVVTVVAVGLVFARVRNEDLFLVNLGYGPVRLVFLLTLVPTLLEVAARAVR